MDDKKIQKKTLKIKSQDAVIVGDLYLANKKKSAKDRAIIVETGITLNRHGLFEEVAQYFANNGINTFVYDKRSHNDSTGEFRCSMLEQDLISIIKFLSRKFHINKFGIFGFCYGGITGMQVTPKLPEIKVFCGVSTYDKWLPHAIAPNNGLPGKSKRRILLARFLNKIGILKFFSFKTPDFHAARLSEGTGFKGNLSEFFQELAKCDDCMDSIKKINKPFFIFHGLKDKFVPEHTTQKIYQTCPSKNKKLFLYSQADHLFSEQRQEMLRDCLTMFEKNLK